MPNHSKIQFVLGVHGCVASLLLIEQEQHKQEKTQLLGVHKKAHYIQDIHQQQQTLLGNIPNGLWER
jgi:hypothetical protein